MQTFYLILKTLHIFAFVAAIGATLTNLIAYRQFWKIYSRDRLQGISAFSIIQGLQIAGMAGMIVLLLAGIGMLAIAHWSFVELTWFQIKLAVIALIFVNGFTTGRTSTMKLKALVEAGPKGPAEAEVALLKSRVRLFFAIQLALFATIVILSVFRFN